MHEKIHAESNAYTVMKLISEMKRVPRMVTFWPHHMKYWQAVVPQERLVCIDPQPVDENRFNPEGKKYDFGEHKGRFNILLADSSREDVDLYEIAHGSNKFQGLFRHG